MSMKKILSLLAGLASAAVAANAQAAEWAQCGGQGWTGQTTCVSGSVCTYSNTYYSECIPASGGTDTDTGVPPSTPTTYTTTSPVGVSSAPTTTPSSYTISVPGQLSWTIIENFNTTTNPNGSITEVVNTTIVEQVSITNFDRSFSQTARKQISDLNLGSKAGASYSGVSFEVSANYGLSTEVYDALEQTTEMTTATTYYKSTQYVRTINVGANGTLTVYQQHFSAPGIDVAGSVISVGTPPSLVEIVNITYTAVPIRFISNITVVYGSSPSDAPPNRILELTGQNDDVNAGFKGQYVWLVPVYTYNADEAAVRFDLFIQGNAVSGWDDLAKGSKGQYRYLRAVADTSNPNKITNLGLDRAGNPVTTFNGTYTGHTTDINASRGGSYLYLLWATRVAY